MRVFFVSAFSSGYMDVPQACIVFVGLIEIAALIIGSRTGDFARQLSRSAYFLAAVAPFAGLVKAGGAVLLLFNPISLCVVVATSKESQETKIGLFRTVAAASLLALILTAPWYVMKFYDISNGDRQSWSFSCDGGEFTRGEPMHRGWSTPLELVSNIFLRESVLRLRL